MQLGNAGYSPFTRDGGDGPTTGAGDSEAKPAEEGVSVVLLIQSQWQKWRTFLDGAVTAS